MTAVKPSELSRAISPTETAKEVKKNKITEVAKMAMLGALAGLIITGQIVAVISVIGLGVSLGIGGTVSFVKLAKVVLPILAAGAGIGAIAGAVSGWMETSN